VDTTGGSDIRSWPTGRLLSVAARLVEQRWTAMLETLDLSHAGLIVLHTLTSGPLPQRALARRCRVTDQTMSRTLDRLQRSGFVERTTDPADGRRLLAAATPEGRDVHERAVRAERDDPLVDDDQAFRDQLIGLVEGLSAPPAALAPKSRRPLT